MVALERQLAPAVEYMVAKDRKVGFVSARVEWQIDRGWTASANQEEIKCPEESDSDDEEKV